MSKDLGEVLDKYCKEIGGADTISLYNNYVVMSHKKGRDYNADQFVEVADRFMSYYINKYDIGE